MKRNIDFSNNKQRIVSLDGLRGVAVLMVLFFHYLNNSFNNAGDGKLNKIELFLKKITYWGWAGVDLFFILSGFLIASILISNRESRTFFKTFYVRRFSRIVPIYYLLIVVFCIANYFLSDTGSRLFINPIAPQWYVAFLQNFQMSLQGKFGPEALTPTWSLAVEEQFYLIIPLVIYFFNDKKVLLFCLMCVVFAPIYRANSDNWYQSYTHFLSRIDSPCFGVMLAIFTKNKEFAAEIRKYAVYILLILVCMIVAFVFFGFKSLNHSLIALIFMFVTAVTIRLREGQMLYKLLASKFLQLMGRYSYFIYLYHILINGLLFLLLTRYTNATIENVYGYLITILSFIATCLLAHFSYYLIESRMISWSHRFKYV